MVQDVTIHIYQIGPDIEVDEGFIRRLGYDPNYCQWAFGTEAEVVKHKGIILK